VKGIFWGALLGSIIVAPDGAIFGAIFADVWLGLLAGALTGAVLGATVGGVAGVVGPRLILKPPKGDHENKAIDSPS